MASGKWKIAAVAGALIVLAFSGLWYFESPAWTLKSMKDAAQSNHPDALDAYIDYPALQGSVRAELAARMAAEAQKDQSAVGTLETAIGSAIMGPLIDELVSPAGLRAALFAKRQETMIPEASPLHVPDNPVIVRRNFSEFIVTTKDRPKSGLIFKRHGLSWMLSGLELPPAASSQ